MSVERRPWVGDLVHDQDADRLGIVTDVQDGVWILRPETGPERWTSERPELLPIVTPREER